MSDKRGFAPIPGQSRLLLGTSIVFLGVVGISFFVVTAFALFDAALWPVVGVLVIPLLVGVGLLIGAVLQRRSYLRNSRNGTPIERTPWEPDVPYSG